MTVDASAGARPEVSAAEAAAVARELWGLDGEVRELGSQQDRNYRVDAASGRVVVKIAHAATDRRDLEAQHEALRLLRRAGLRVPSAVAARDGEHIVPVGFAGGPHLVRVLVYVDGEPLIETAGYGEAEAALVGDTAGRVAAALAALDVEPSAHASQWDIREGARVVDDLIDAVTDPARRALVRAATDSAAARVAALADLLPPQPIHADVTDDNLVRDSDGRVGVIDFGDLMVTWRVAELVAASACAYMRDEPDALFLATVRGFAAHVALTDAELDALWPLVVLRCAVLVVSGEHQVALDGDNDYADERRGAEWRAFAAAAARDAGEMAYLVRAVARGLDDPRADATATLLPAGIAAASVDLSVTSDALAAGDWLVPGIEERVLRSAGGLAHTRWGEFRLTRTRLLAPRGGAATLALGVDLVAPEGCTLAAPFAGRVVATRTGLALHGDDATLWVDGVAPFVLGEVAPGARLGDASRGDVVHVQLGPADDRRPPACVTPRLADLWRRISPDPSRVLGVAASAPVIAPADTLARRDAHVAAAQEHYYSRPPQIERGWREHLIDTEAQTYVDVVNNVTIAGHAHPGIVDAAARQWALLNTNSRFHYAAIAELSERLAALAPAALDRVFLVNSGSEAVDLALRLAFTATGRGRILAAREAYHGWTIGSDAVSTSIGDNPRALETRPDWVELLDAPNPVRGTHRGRGSAAAYLADVDARLDALGADGRAQLAGVVIEPIFGNGGGVLLPDGYLAGLYERVRALGGVCVSDEVQVGYGRLGAHFWGFEQQGAVPDVIAVAKAMGNGQPLGAVITTAAIAEAFEQEGSFFSSAGGSPVSARVGVAVLDALRDDDLQGNAQRVGALFGDALRALGTRHPSIGAVHGMGLYLGVELVVDADLTPAPELARRVCDLLLYDGCIVQPTGDHKNVLKIKPPLCITAESVAWVVAALDRALAAA